MQREYRAAPGKRVELPPDFVGGVRNESKGKREFTGYRERIFGYLQNIVLFPEFVAGMGRFDVRHSVFVK